MDHGINAAYYKIDSQFCMPPSLSWEILGTDSAWVHTNPWYSHQLTILQVPSFSHQDRRIIIWRTPKNYPNNGFEYRNVQLNFHYFIFYK